MSARGQAAALAMVPALAPDLRSIVESALATLR
jgi:hypothetical protein